MLRKVEHIGIQVRDLDRSIKFYTEVLGFTRGSSSEIVNVCVLLGTEKGIVKKARVALGAIGTLPVRCPEAEKFLLRKKVSEDTARELRAVVDLLQRHRIPWYRTDQNGTITITVPSDHSNYRVTVERGEPNMRGPSDRPARSCGNDHRRRRR